MTQRGASGEAGEVGGDADQYLLEGGFRIGLRQTLPRSEDTSLAASSCLCKRCSSLSRTRSRKNWACFGAVLGNQARQVALLRMVFPLKTASLNRFKGSPRGLLYFTTVYYTLL